MAHPNTPSVQVLEARKEALEAEPKNHERNQKLHAITVQLRRLQLERETS